MPWIAWPLKQKLMQTMAQHDAFYRLQRRVEINDAYRGAERAGHTNGGRKAANKTAFVAAVQTHPDGHPLYVHPTPVTDLPDQEMHQWEQQHLAPRCHEVSDGTRAFAQVCQAQSTHERHLTGGGRQGAQAPPLRWVNAVLGNLKTCLPCDPDC